jgi:hypothetical protein
MNNVGGRHFTGRSTSYDGMKNVGVQNVYTERNLKAAGNASFARAPNSHTYRFGAETRFEGFPAANRLTSCGPKFAS